MSTPDFKKNYFQLFNLPEQFALDQAQLGARYRHLQGELHPDRYAGSSDHEQRVAVQYSALVNEGYATLRKPLARALYLLELAGMSQQEISGQQIAGGFLIEQMELREKLESMDGLVDPDTVLDHLVTEISGDIKMHQAEFAQAYAADELAAAAAACVKMQYLEKLLREAEQIESDLMDKR
jgi:molecular chaperone HscB